MVRFRFFSWLSDATFSLFIEFGKTVSYRKVFSLSRDAEIETFFSSFCFSSLSVSFFHMYFSKPFFLLSMSGKLRDVSIHICRQFFKIRRICSWRDGFRLPYFLFPSIFPNFYNWKIINSIWLFGKNWLPSFLREFYLKVFEEKKSQPSFYSCFIVWTHEPPQKRSFIKFRIPSLRALLW